MRWQRQQAGLAVAQHRSLIGYLRDESGATAIEYSLILGLVVLAVAGSINLLSDSLSNMYMFVSSSVTGVVNGG